MIHVTVRLPLDSFELDVSLDLNEPMTALFGPSGVGKTSLLETIAGLRQPAEGEIRIDEELLFSSRQRVWLPPELRRVGYVPQDALLFPHMSVRRNLGYGSRLVNRKDLQLSVVYSSRRINCAMGGGAFS
ncbi:MAG TPA: ATP-binding cassette domain-containing protein [Vicinamibacteria bacterium]|nr:ATP-binding cassette domain-containing protein [Vicinamibacteria bacterium]